MPPRSAASDVDGLLLGCQQSVHGSWHRLHVDLQAETHISCRRGLQGCVGAAARLGRLSRYSPLPAHPLSNTDLTQAASRKSRIHGLSKALGVIESEERKPECSTFPKALALTRLWLVVFFFFLRRKPLKTGRGQLWGFGCSCLPPSPRTAVQTPVQPGRTRELQIRLESET